MYPVFDTSHSNSSQNYSQQQLSPEPSYYAVIPANVRYNKHLEPSAKLLYGEITALCRREGYCWASNKYFSDLYEVDERTIQRWLKSLKEQEFISVYVEQNGFNSIRKIFICDQTQKIVTERQKCQGATTKMSSPGDKNATHNTTSNNTKKKQQQAVAVFECLKDLQIPDHEKAWLSQHYKEEDLIKAIAWATAPTTKITKSLEQAIKWWLKNPTKPVAGPHIEEVKQQHCKDAHNLEKLVCSDKARFVAGPANCQVYPTSNTLEAAITFEYGEKNFHIEVKKVLDKYQFKKKQNT